MGGQACVLYGAAEFSRDADLAIEADESNIDNLRNAIDDLQASVIAVPPFDLKYLKRGHAVHFRCMHPEAAGVRVDVMSVMRGVDPFPELWVRRTTIALGVDTLEVMSLPDLVTAKKTQRDKDWPMIRRLVEASYFENFEAPTPEQLEFWFKELRSPDILLKLALEYPRQARDLSRQREVVQMAISGVDESLLAAALYDEEQKERQADKIYWAPLRRELETLRHSRT